jgi:galactose oxidase-like protein
MMRDALLAGGVIAASAVAALIALDPGPLTRPHFGFVAPVSERSDSAGSASGSVKSHATTHVRHAVTDADALPKQIGFAPPSKKTKTTDATMVMLVPDLPHDNSEPPPSGVWNDQGSAAPVGGNNSQPSQAIAMSAVGGISAPPISPTGALPASPASSNNLAPPSSPSAPPSHASVAPHPGFVLLSGGQGNGQFALASAELFDPAKSAFAAASSMKDARENHTATALPSGKVLIAGGEGLTGRALSSAELYDPINGKFSAVEAKMDTARSGHTATLISGCNCPADGKVLIAGGATLGATIRSAELYDPAAGKFTPTGAMKATRSRHSATLIGSGPLAGNVLIAGGTSDEGGGDVATAELYDPATGQFTLTGRMSTPRENHSATFLSPSVAPGALAGNVLIAGGADAGAASDSAEVFNPQTAAFSPVGTMTSARTMQAAVLLGSGKVLIAGGQSSDTDFLQSAELFDPAHATFAATGSMQNLHVGAMATVLENGNALIAGGRSSFADLYDPMAGTFSATGKMVTDVSESTSTLIR